MSIFGWSYPPGAANDPNAPYNQTDEGPCYVCGQSFDECVCPECDVCGETGNVDCYDGMVSCSWCGVKTMDQIESCLHCLNIDQHPLSEPVSHTPHQSHGLIRSFAQVALRLEAERRWEEEARAESGFWEEEARVAIEELEREKELAKKYYRSSREGI